MYGFNWMEYSISQETSAKKEGMIYNNHATSRLAKIQFMNSNLEI